MWILLLIPVTSWLMSEMFEAGRRVRLTLGVLSLASVAWVTYDYSTESSDMAMRIETRMQVRALRAIRQVALAGDTNRLIAAFTNYENLLRTNGTLAADEDLLTRLRGQQ
jgi:hypothetical protein